MWPLTTFEATYFDITRRNMRVAVLTATVLGLFMLATVPLWVAGAAAGNGVAFSAAGGWALVVPLVVPQGRAWCRHLRHGADVPAAAAPPARPHLAAVHAGLAGFVVAAAW